MNTEEQKSYMCLALSEAKKAWGLTHPNPMVGAVVIKDRQVLGVGYHREAGEAHAEIDAFNNVGDRETLKGATLFVTLEPCSTTGRTPPCTEAIIASGIEKVIIGMLDPNPKHAGRGIDILRNAGIEVVSHVLQEECEDLNLIFNHWIRKKTPFIAGKVATTLDGKIAARTGQSHWITGVAARADVMRWRRYFPAIGVGSGTVLEDNPRLTSRLDNVWCPVRLVFDRRLRTIEKDSGQLPLLYSDVYRDRTIIVTEKESELKQRDRLDEIGIQCWGIESEDQSNVPDFWMQFRKRCVDAGICGVFIEGGAGLLSSILRHQELDYLFNYNAPRILGDDDAKSFISGFSPKTIEEGVHLDEVKHAVLGNDILTRGYISVGAGPKD